MKRYRLTGADGREFLSDTPGAFGGYGGTGVYGRFDWPAALRALARGDTYRRNRVFANEATAAVWLKVMAMLMLPPSWRVRR
jgi:hypothetical protein